MLGNILCRSPSIVYRWVVEAMEKTQEPQISSGIKEMEFDEMWYFLQKKEKNSGLSKRWIVVQGELLPGLHEIMMLQRSGDFMTKSNI